MYIVWSEDSKPTTPENAVNSCKSSCDEFLLVGDEGKRSSKKRKKEKNMSKHLGPQTGAIVRCDTYIFSAFGPKDARCKHERG